MSTTTEAAPKKKKKKLSPRRRAQRIRWIQYALLVVVAVAIALAADWEQIMAMGRRIAADDTLFAEAVGEDKVADCA